MAELPASVVSDTPSVGENYRSVVAYANPYPECRAGEELSPPVERNQQEHHQSDYTTDRGFSAKRLSVTPQYYVRMSGATTEGDGEDEIVTVNFKLTESFLEEIDDTWQGRGFNSRSEFIRYTLRDAVEFPTFDRDELVALLAAEADAQDGRTMSAEEARERFGTSDE